MSRAPGGNLVRQGTEGSDSLDFSNLAKTYNGVDYVTLGGNDRIRGTIYDDTFTLGTDAEYVDGGRGLDTVIYSNSTARVSVNLNNVTQHGGFAEGDQLSGIENVTGSQYGDLLVGDARANVLDGQDGNDRIDGGDGNDTLHGGAGDDRLRGGMDDDILRGGAGADTLDGGDGSDTVDYSDSPMVDALPLFAGISIPGTWGVYVDLDDDVVGLGHAEGDTLVSIENARGSAFDDLLFGDEGANELFGNAGNDHMRGGAGGDLLDGGEGDRDIVDYSRSQQGVTVNLATGSAYGGDATGDVLVGIEYLIGSQQSDSLTGSHEDNKLDGRDGSDALNGREGEDRIVGGGGMDYLTGGADADTFVFDADAGDSDVDIVLDFELGTDVLEFFGNADGMQHILLADYAGGSSPPGVVISYGSESGLAGQVLLTGISASELMQYADTTFTFSAPVVIEVLV